MACTNLAQAGWRYWGTAPDGVTAIYSNESGHLSSSMSTDDFGCLHAPTHAYQGALGASDSNGVLNCNDGRSWNILNGLYYQLHFPHDE
jgi:hypothetical protein